MASLAQQLHAKRYHLTGVSSHEFHPHALQESFLDFYYDGTHTWVDLHWPVNHCCGCKCKLQQNEDHTTIIFGDDNEWTLRCIISIHDDPTGVGGVVKSYRELDKMMARLFCDHICYKIHLEDEDQTALVLENEQHKLCCSLDSNLCEKNFTSRDNDDDDDHDETWL